MKPMILTAVLLLAEPALAQSGPSFDCARAKAGIETVICGNPALARLDREIAAAYAAALGRFGAGGRAALQESQQEFLGNREIAITWPREEERVETLQETMKDRLDLLSKLRAAPLGEGPSAFLGEWKADHGSVKIARGKGGRLAIEISTFALVTARWLCDGSGEARIAGGRLQFKEDGVTIVLSRRGPTLTVEEHAPAGSGVRGTCGANGSLRGTFFKVD